MTKGGEFKIITGELQVMTWDASFQGKGKSKELEQIQDGAFMYTLMSMFYPKADEVIAICEPSTEDQTDASGQLAMAEVGCLSAPPAENSPSLSPAQFVRGERETLEINGAMDEAPLGVLTSSTVQFDVSQNLPFVLVPDEPEENQIPVSKTLEKLPLSSIAPVAPKSGVQHAPVEADYPTGADSIDTDRGKGQDAKDLVISAEGAFKEISEKPTSRGVQASNGQNSEQALKTAYEKPAFTNNLQPVQKPLEVPVLETTHKQVSPPRFDLAKAKEISRYLYTESLKRLPRTVEFRIEPPELGQVTVRLAKKGESVAVRFEAGSPSAIQALSHAKDDLKQSLAFHGLSLEGFSVEGEAAGGMSQNGRFTKHGLLYSRGKTLSSKNKGMDQWESLTLKRGCFDYLV